MSQSLDAATAKKPSLAVRKSVLKKEWLRAREVILPILIDLLRQHLPSTWIKASDLFNDTTIPVEVNPTSFLKAIFQMPDEEVVGGSQVYYGSGGEDDHRYLVVRHRFHGYFYLRGCFKRRSVELDPLIREAVWRVPDRESVFPNANFELVCSRLSELLVEGALKRVVNAQKDMVDRSRLVTPASDRQTRADTFVNGLQAASNPARHIKAMRTLTKGDQQEVIVKQQRIIKKLSQKSARDDAIINRIDNDKTAIEVLGMFRGDLSRKAFVNRLLESNEVSESNCVLSTFTLSLIQSAGRLSIKLMSYETTSHEVAHSTTHWTRIAVARIGAAGSLCLTHLTTTCSRLVMITSIPVETIKF